MAGHSKWANVKHRKGAQDVKRGKIFTKIIREITTAARMSADPNSPRLRTAVDKGLSNNMSRDIIDRAIKRGIGVSDDLQMSEVRYEGYGPLGTAVMVDCLTDNHKRTVSDVRNIFNKCGGNLGTDGSVSYLFTRVGQIILAPGSNEEKVMEVALEAGANDVVMHEDASMEIITPSDSLFAVNEALKAAKVEVAIAEVIMQPATTLSLHGEASLKFSKMIDLLEDLDDVQSVHHNAILEEEYN